MSEKNIIDLRKKAINIIEKCYTQIPITSKVPSSYFICSTEHPLLDEMKLGKKIKLHNVIDLINSGDYDKQLEQYYNKNKQPNNVITIEKKFEDQNLQNRYEELIKAVNNNMPLSFFWLAGSIIERVLCEYCKKNNIKPEKYDIDGYITALYPDEKNKKNNEKNSKLPQSNALKHILNIYRNYRNTIHPNNGNNDYINGKHLQNRREELDDVIKYFSK